MEAVEWKDEWKGDRKRYMMEGNGKRIRTGMRDGKKVWMEGRDNRREGWRKV